MLASYVLSRTLVPTLAMYLLKAHRASPRRTCRLESRRHDFNGRSNVHLKRRARHIATCLRTCIRRRGLFLPVFLALCAAAFLLVPWLGHDFFPTTDAGQFNLHFRAKTGTRIEETARLGD